MKLGWVEIYKGTDPDHYRKIEETLQINQIRYRGYEFNNTNKMAAVSMQYAPQSVQRGPSFNPAGAYVEYAGKEANAMYSLEIMRKDLNRFHSIRSEQS